MKKIFIVILYILFAGIALATTVPLQKNGTSQSLIYSLDSLSADHFLATSTTASSTFSNGINLTNGCFSISGTCVGAGGSGTVTSVGMTIPTGLSISGTPITTSGILALTYTSGYAGVLTASTTNWNAFYDTPSTRITAGTNLSWSGNTLNATGGGGSGTVGTDFAHFPGFVATVA